MQPHPLTLLAASILVAANPTLASGYAPAQWIVFWDDGTDTMSLDYNRVKRSGNVYTAPITVVSKESPFSGWAHVDCRTRNYALSGSLGRSSWFRGAPDSAPEKLADILCRTQSGSAVASDGRTPAPSSGQGSPNAGFRTVINTIDYTPSSVGLDPEPSPAPLPEPSLYSGTSDTFEKWLSCVRSGVSTSTCSILYP